MLTIPFSTTVEISVQKGGGALLGRPGFWILPVIC
jgi:hypothetical protein